jgi:hypothetical protein
MFTSEAIADEICMIPAACILSHHRALTSELGASLLAATPDIPQDLVLFLYMILGRNDAAHPLYVYLSTLPREPQSLPHWLPIYHDMLAGTALHTSVKAALAEISELAELASSLPAPYNAVTRDEIAWAHDMY